MQEQRELTAVIKEISDRHWSEQGSPVLLSALAPLIAAKLVDYRVVLAGRTLKAFIKETKGEAGYELVEHPSQRARVGVVPAGVSYEFSTDSSSVKEERGSSKSNREVTLAFLRMLSSLPDADLNNVIIPTSILVKLLK